MNQLLALFLNQIEFSCVDDGALCFICEVGSKFINAERYAQNVPRGEDSELLLEIKVLTNGSIVCDIFNDYGLLDRKSFNIVNATIGSIEQFVLTANIDATKPLVLSEENQQVIEPVVKIA